MSNIPLSEYRSLLARILSSRNRSFWFGLLGICVLRFVWSRSRHPSTQLPSLEQYIEKRSEVYDVIIVGGGPAGSTCAYYLAKAGKRVLLLEKKDKICGDCITPTAQKHLLEMGVLQEILAEHKGRWLQRGGFVSASGRSFVSDFTTDREMCIQRIILDAHMARAAERAGAHIRQQHHVFDVRRDGSHWRVHAVETPESADSAKEVFLARMLVAADGAQGLVSSMLCPSQPNAVAVRSFVKPGTHSFRADKVVFYPRSLLPGFCVVCRELEGYLSVTSYAMPNCSPGAVAILTSHRALLDSNPLLSEALGHSTEWTPTQSALLRVGGVETSYGDQFLLIGDSAGFADPLTGQGVQFAMEGARIAAHTIVEAIARNNMSKEFLRRYQDRWQRKFGWGFLLSRLFARLVARYPTILDGACSTIRSNGESWTAAWNSALSGHKSKLWFLRPDVGVIILLETFRLWVLEKMQRHAVPPFLRQLVMPKSKLRDLFGGNDASYR